MDVTKDYNKVVAVIKSCTTAEHFAAAVMMIKLFCDKTRDFPRTKELYRLYGDEKTKIFTLHNK